VASAFFACSGGSATFFACGAMSPSGLRCLTLSRATWCVQGKTYRNTLNKALAGTLMATVRCYIDVDGGLGISLLIALAH